MRRVSSLSAFGKVISSDASFFVSPGRSGAFRMQNYKKEMNTAYFLLEKYQKQ